MKSNQHAIYNLNYRLVVVKEYRHPVIDEQIKKRLVENAHNLFSKWKCELIEFNGEEEHIHIIFDALPQINLSNTINSFKSVSSRYIRKEFENESKVYYWKPYFWSRSYFIFTTGGTSLETIKKYVQNQGVSKTKVNPN
jgi:putative transposase